MIDQIHKWLADPPPEHLFEVSEFALAAASSRAPAQQKKHVLSERALAASPSAPNLLKPQLYREALATSAKPGKRANSAIVIPDYAVRMAVLDFEQFPVGESERMALLRFRLRKSVPFPIDEAQLSYSIQFTNERLVEVLVVAVARPILVDYERIFADAGYKVGMVLPSIIATLPLCTAAEQGVTLIAKATGFTLTVLLLQPGRIRLLRCVDLTGGDESDGGFQPNATPLESARILMPLLQQTMAFAEDQLGEPVSQVLLAGFDHEIDHFAGEIIGQFGISVRKLTSRFGPAGVENSGLLGMLEKYAA